MANVEGLGHSAEVDPHSGGGGCGDAEGHANVLTVQSEELGARGRSSHCSGSRGGVPTLGVVGVADSKTELALQLEADEESLQDTGAGCSQFLAQSQDGWYEGCARVAHTGVVDIVKVEGVGQDAVDEGGGEGVGPVAATYDGGGGVALATGEGLCEDGNGLVLGCCERDSHCVQNGPLAKMLDIGGDIIKLRPVDKVDSGVGGPHSVSPPKICSKAAA